MLILQILQEYLNEIQQKLFTSRGKLSHIAHNYSITPSLISYIYSKFQEIVINQQGLRNLVTEKQIDHAIAIDETFLKINGATYYIIMATGYTTHKILGIKVSKSWTMEDILDVFQEADKNTESPISIITTDAWGGTRALAKYLDRPITIIIHKHKTPYEKVVIKRYEYDSDVRHISIIGIKSDFCKKRKTREFHYIETHEKRYPPPLKKRGRTKGVKNGQGTKKPYVKRNVKRGRKGLFSVFDRGKRGYARVDPHRKTVRIGRDISKVVAATLEDVVKLFEKRFIQNNLAEHKNSVLSNYLVLTGPKSSESIEKRLRTFIICQNNPELLPCLQIEHHFQRNFFHRQICHYPIRLVLMR